MGFARFVIYGMAGLIGIGAGAYSALSMSGLTAGDRRIGNGINIDGWVGDFSQGSADASPYLRARVARHGLLAMAKSEAVYFIRDTDDAGERLNDRCSYRISGGGLPARWWSVTLYDAENFLPDNIDAALSFDASRAGDGTWSATIASARPEGGEHWISSRNSGEFDLTLRLYVPEDGVLDRPAELIDPPKIERLSCEGGAA